MLQSTPQFESQIDLLKPAVLRGFVFAPDAPQMRWSLGIFLNGDLIGTYHAIDPVPDCFDIHTQPFDCGFEINLGRSVFAETDVLQVRVLNTEHVVAHLLLKQEKRWRSATEDDRPGHVRHAHGLTLSGVLDDAITELPSHEILVWKGEEIVGRTRVYRWQHVGDGHNKLGKRVGFDILLDKSLADGEPHVLRVETETGQPLYGSPVTIIAYPNAFREACEAVADPTRSRMADMALARLMENSVPLAAYGELFPEIEDPHPAPDSCHGYQILHHESVQPLASIAQLLENMDAPIVYFDLAMTSGAECYPLLLPAYDHERQLEQGYAALLFALRSDLYAEARRAGADTPSAIFFHALQQIDPSEILHIPRPRGICDEARLASLHQEHLDALAEYLDANAEADVEIWPRKDTVFPACHIRRAISEPALTVIIPTRNQGRMLWECVQSLRARNPGIDLDLIIVDNLSDEPATAKVFEQIEKTGGRILEFDSGFNYALINNLAARHARHPNLCFLNNDVAFSEPGVLTELLGRLQSDNVGAVGPLMRRASDIIQHGGVVLGPHAGACHAFEDRMYPDVGYGELLRVAHECAAVTGALMVTRTALFEELGGFEERLFPVNFNDVDYCLRLRAAGYRVVFSPHVCVQHFESVSRGRENRSVSATRMLREVQMLRERWGHVIRNDPFFHPQFSRDTLPYRALTSRPVKAVGRKSVIEAPRLSPRWS